jgi:hypothetical protein
MFIFCRNDNITFLQGVRGFFPRFHSWVLPIITTIITITVYGRGNSSDALFGS